jgi:two-component system sensor histidine kinase KdpD
MPRTTTSPLRSRYGRHAIQSHPLRPFVAGVLVALVATVVLTGFLLPFRDELSVTTDALVLVVPVALAAAAGGLSAGLVGVVFGFLAYDLVFIPPYGTLAVGAGQNWVALGVYVAVMIVVTRVVDRLRLARAEAARHEESTRRLFELSDVLIADKPLGELLSLVVNTVHATFGLKSVCVLLPAERGLEVAATAGEGFGEDELAAVWPHTGSPASLELPTGRSGSVVAVLLSVPGGPVGALLVKGEHLRPAERALLRTYANQAALALERARLREQALRNELLEQADRWKDALVSAVSHDLRTPLATIKAAISELRRAEGLHSAEDADELLGLVEGQADRLARLVTNLLDLTRISAGTLELHREVVAVEELIAEAVEALAGTDVPERVHVEVEEDLPLVEVDPVLVRQALVNLLDNASVHAPGTGRIDVEARLVGQRVQVRVADDGAGVPPTERERIFLLFKQSGAAGRAGIGLALVKAFIEAHGERVWLEEGPLKGACLAFSLPLHVPVTTNGPVEARH